MNTIKNMKALAWITVAMVLSVSVYFIWQMKENASMETNLDEYMPRTHPAFVYSDMAEDWFNIKDGILIAIENKHGIYNSQTLGKIRDITEALEEMPEFDSNDVLSLYAADNITGTEWGFDVCAFYRHVPDLSNVRLNGFVRNYTGVFTNKDGDLSILQNTFNLNFSSRGDKIAFRVNPYTYHYFDKELELGLREAYMDMYFNNFDLRVGKQQIIWGKAEGVFITDVVAPKDLREFLLPDFDEIRLGITALKLNYYSGNSTLEAVWVPVFTPTRMPESGSMWQPRLAFPAPVSYD